MDLEEKKKASEFLLKYMKKAEFDNSQIEKTWDSFDENKMYEISKEDIESLRKKDKLLV